MNSMTTRKVTNGDWSVPYKLSEGKWALIHLDDSCALLRSPFVTFLDVIELVSLISF
jgi:hypothetical protein